MKSEEEREAALGFSPQKELLFSSLLPYADDIDVESNAALAEIKTNLGRAVQLRDIKIGCRHWIVQLERYISIYGYKFSKTDHVLLVKLVFELLTMPLKEYALVDKFAVVLTNLLKKRLLSRDDLTLPWRPLYQLVEDCNKDVGGCRVFTVNFETRLKSAVRACAPYFHEDATREILDEFRPWLCPFDMMVIGALQCLELFLPTSLPPELHHKGFKLWLDEFMQLWKSFYSMPSWEGSLVNLFSRLAHDNVGYIDWSPHIPMIFTRLLRSFNLPVGTKQLVQNNQQNSYDIQNVSTWIISIMVICNLVQNSQNGKILPKFYSKLFDKGGPDNVIQEHITKLFKALHSFFHPSNAGRWSLRLGSFLQNLPKSLVKRIRRERYKEIKWLTPIPESHKITDAQVTEFVESLKPSLFVAIFSKMGSQDASMGLRNLATLRPELVIPPFLEKMYPAMETLIEPHRLIACMVCVVHIARPMLTSTRHFPEGPSHVLPLLNLALPGIDPNDFRKTLVTLQMISTFVTLIPIVDSSEAIHVVQDLTEHERELCSATAQFEDFVLAFLDRIFNLIESNSQESSLSVVERQFLEHTVLEVGIGSTVSAMLQQCSIPIYMSALKKIHRFITSSVFEVKVSGKLAANFCRAAVRIKPEIALKMFVPHLCSHIKSFLQDHPGVYEEEHLDNAFMWNLLILSQIMRCDGTQLMAYKLELLDVVQTTLKLKCVQAYEMAGQMLRFLLRSLTQIYPLEFRSVEQDFDQPFTEYLPIRDWGTPGDLEDLNIQWHLPSQEEVNFAQELLDCLLTPELELFLNISTDNEVSKEDLLRRLNLVIEFLSGAGSHLAPLDGEKVPLVDSQVPLIRFSCYAGLNGKELTAKGRNVRESVHDAIGHLLKYLNTSREDDTKSLFSIIRIYELVLMHYGTVRSEFDNRWKSFHIVKSSLENQLVAKKKHLRALLIDRMQLQHELRTFNFCERHFTERHSDITTNLLNLSVSRYREVRKKAQTCLHKILRTYAFSYQICLDTLVENLVNTEVEEHVFKGSLHTILGGGKTCLANKRNWETLLKIWPALVQAQHSEKPSILHVIEDIMNKVFKGLETFAIEINTPAEVIDCAGKLLSEGTAPRSGDSLATPEELQSGIVYEKTVNGAALQNFNALVDKIMNLVQSGKLTWKFNQIGYEFLSLLIHEDIQPSPQFISIFTKNCASDLLYVRKLSLNAVATSLEVMKRKPKKIVVDLEKAAGVGPINYDIFAPGDREDNKWLQYDPANFITSEEDWNKHTFIEKTHWGYYCWPKELKTYAPYPELPKLDRTREELTDSEKALYDCWTNPEYVAQVFEYLALEEDKNTDKYRMPVVKYFKCLFRNFGDTFLEQCKPHIEKYAKDQSHNKHSSSQRCAMEALAGLINGSKIWPYPKLESMWAWITPILEHVLANLTVDTLEDWSAFFMHICENRAPHKLQWLYKLLLNNPLNGEGGAFGDTARLCVLQQAILQQEWRIPQYLHAIVEYLRPHMAHNYKSVRDRMGTLLVSILHTDFTISPDSRTRCPSRADIIRSVLPQLEQFRDIVKASPNNGAAILSSTAEPMETDATNSSEDEEAKKTAIRLCKTITQWLSSWFNRSLSACPEEVFQLLPIIESLQSEANDEDLRADCKMVLLCLSRVLVPEQSIGVILATVKEVSGLKSWHARANILNYMQQMVFGNFFMVQSKEHKHMVQTLLLHLLCDEQLEVREMAAVTLSGMIHCSYVELDKDMLDHFEQLRSTKVKKIRKSNPEQGAAPSSDGNVPLQRLIQRHAGVLGLSACVQAYPYDVPDFIPQVLVDLSFHVNDPQPIGTTVTKTLSDFRRTHHDNWHDHKRMFTDDQLVTLTEVLVSPNYYA